MTKSSAPRAWGIYPWSGDPKLESAPIAKETAKVVVLGHHTAFSRGRTHIPKEEGIARSPSEAVERALAKEREALVSLEAQVDQKHNRIRALEELAAQVASGEIPEVT